MRNIPNPRRRAAGRRITAAPARIQNEEQALRALVSAQRYVDQVHAWILDLDDYDRDFADSRYPNFISFNEADAEMGVFAASKAIDNAINIIRGY